MLKTKLWVLLLAIPFFMGTADNVWAAGFNFPQNPLAKNTLAEDQKRENLLAKFIPQAVQLGETNFAPKNSLASIENKKIDIRVQVLRAYLAQYDSPLQNKAESFVAAADEYGLDWKLVAAISGVESTFGKFIPGSPDYSSYNAWGWGVYGDQAIYFKSWDEGIYTVSQGLKENYIDRGLTDPYTINRMYSTSSAWGDHVSYFLNDMDQFEQVYKAKATARINPELTPKIAGSSGLLAMR